MKKLLFLLIIPCFIEGQIIIVGAGASGLAAAKKLEKNGIEYLILEASDHYGWRIQKINIILN